jgi:hypothetical protein
VRSDDGSVIVDTNRLFRSDQQAGDWAAASVVA